MLALITNYLAQNWERINPSLPKPRGFNFLMMNGGLACNLKATFLVFADKPVPLMVIRITDDACGKDYIKQEHNNLATLSDKYKMGGAVPKALKLTEMEGHILLFQSCVDGAPLLKYRRPNSFSQSCDWLIDFHLKTKQKNISKEFYAQNIKAQIDFIAKSIDLSPELRRFLAEISRECDKLSVCASVFSHNDFSPRNIMITRDKIISGVIDWEYAQVQGMPLRDLYHLAASYYQTKGLKGQLASTRQAFFEGNSFSSLVREKIIEYCDALGIDSALAELFFWLYLILPMEESVRLSMPYFPLWEGKLFVLESLVKQRHSLRFIVK